MTWRYVVMANGKGIRWGNHLGIPKHLITIGDETLIQRITRQIREADPTAEVVISSSDPRCTAVGARRHEPLSAELELDRFVPELITDKTCFLYGDTYYTDDALRQIVEHPVDDLHFFVTDRAVVGMKSADPDYLRQRLDTVRRQFLAGELADCKGWQVLNEHAHVAGEGVAVSTHISDSTGDFNSPKDLRAFKKSEDPK